MSSSVRQLVVEEIRRRAVRIKVANSFNTNAGDNVFLGEEVVLSADDGGVAIAIAIGDVVVEDDVGMGTPTVGAELSCRMQVSVQAVAVVGDLEEPWISAEQLVQDIKNAMEDPDTDSFPDEVMDFGVPEDRDTTLERDEGSTHVGVAVNYEVLYIEKWGSI